MMAGSIDDHDQRNASGSRLVMLETFKQLECLALLKSPHVDWTACGERGQLAANLSLVSYRKED